jgi:hypothetical protein
MFSEKRKSSRPRKKTILSHLSRTAFQILSTTVAPTNQPSTTAKNQGEKAAPSYSKQNVYPPSPMNRSLQEIFDKELFSEKCR